MKMVFYIILGSLSMNAIALNHPTCELRLDSYLAADGTYKKLERVPQEYKHELKHILREKGYVIVEDHEIFDESSMLLMSYGAGIPIRKNGNFKCFMEFNISQADKDLKKVSQASGWQFMLKSYACTEIYRSLVKQIPVCKKLYPILVE